MKNVLHVIDSEEPGGAEQVFLDLLDGIDQVRFRHTAVVPGGGWLSEQLRYRNFDVYKIPCSGAFNINYLWQLCKLIKVLNIDLIQSHLLGANVYCSLAGFLWRVPVISVFHGAVDIADDERFKLLKKIVISFGSYKVVAVSNFLMQDIIARLDMSRDKVVVIYNGVDTERYSPGSNQAVRNRLGIPQNHLLACSVGHIRPSKGYAVLIEAARLLRNKGCKVSFVVAGDTSSKYFKSLQELIYNYQLEDVVYFLGNLAEPIELLRSADIFVLPSISEGFSISTIEAMAAGLPVIVTRSGGPEEIVHNNKNGFLVEANSPEKLAEKIEDICCKDLVISVTDAARGHIQKYFTLEAMCKAYENLYDTVFYCTE